MKELENKINDILTDHLEHLVDNSRIEVIKHLIKIEIDTYLMKESGIDGSF